MIPWWVLALLVFGANFTLWGSVGLMRLVESLAVRGRRAPRRAVGPGAASEAGMRVLRSGGGAGAGAKPVDIGDVAVLIAAHNERVVIEDSIRSVLRLVPRKNVHVVSDGSHDHTYKLARRTGVKVIRTRKNVGKAGALQEAIGRFKLVERFRVVMLLDADTRVDADYFTAALPMFDDANVVAVAGCVETEWRRRELSPVGKLLVCHRERIYALTQYLLKFGQTWLRVNATHIVPGFASLYRTEVLPHIEMNPPGLVIEDFNMTFEVYQKGLGKVGFTPSAVALTQDPDNLRDYVRQTRRWSLGLWQTVRRHPPRANLFTVMLALLLLELLTSSILIMLIPVVLVVLAVPEVFELVLGVPGVAEVHAVTAAHFSLGSLLVGVVLPDLVLTCAVALLQRRPRFLVFGCFFLPLRVLDSALSLHALALAWSTSSGRWRSPDRRAIG